jgi:hypothetical protein
MLVHLQYFLYSKRDAIFASVVGLSIAPSVFLMCYIIFEYALYQDVWLRAAVTINGVIGMVMLPVTIAFIVDTVVQAIERRISDHLWKNSDEYVNGDVE